MTDNEIPLATCGVLTQHAPHRHFDADNVSRPCSGEQGPALFTPNNPGYGRTVYFEHEGRMVPGEVRGIVFGAGQHAVTVFSADLGHTHTIDHGVTVDVADLLPEQCDKCETAGQNCFAHRVVERQVDFNLPMNADPALVYGETVGTPTDVVIIRATVEDMIGTTQDMEIPRAEWDALTPAQRNARVNEFGAETMNNCGGYGASILSGAPDSDLDGPKPPASTLADDVAALRSLIQQYMLETRGQSARTLAFAALDRIAGAVPQPTRVWMHRCGVVLINDTQPPPCHVCVSTPQIPFVRLYTLGEVR